MFHLEYLQNNIECQKHPLLKKASGRYYTNKIIGKRLATKIKENLNFRQLNNECIRIIDPFAGDGRLIEWLIISLNDKFKQISWEANIWDTNEQGLFCAKEKLEKLRESGIKIKLKTLKVDTFKEAIKQRNSFDIVITNPPWEVLKPDKRETNGLPSILKDNYISKMKDYDKWISNQYPISQPKQKFAGWGTNLSRVGLEVCMNLVKTDGIIGIVLPSSFLADNQSQNLRKYIFNNASILDLAYYPAESKLFEDADIQSMTTIIRKNVNKKNKIPLYTYELNKIDNNSILDLKHLNNDFSFPISFGVNAIELLSKLAMKFPKWIELENDVKVGFWAGREIDETGYKNWLRDNDTENNLFIKGRMIDRYKICEFPKHQYINTNKTIPHSVSHKRIAWRDVSRPTQKRRIKATIIPAKWIAGNSLGIAYFKDDNDIILNNFLGIMNSTVFEFQLRAFLSTSHVSLSSLRKVSIPDFSLIKNDVVFSSLINNIYTNNVDELEYRVDAYVARKFYNLNITDYSMILSLFPKITKVEFESYICEFLNIEGNLK